MFANVIFAVMRVCVLAQKVNGDDNASALPSHLRAALQGPVLEWRDHTCTGARLRERRGGGRRTDQREGEKRRGGKERREARKINAGLSSSLAMSHRDYPQIHRFGLQLYHHTQMLGRGTRENLWRKTARNK